MILDILVPLLTIGIAEFGDKSQLMILCLASKTKSHLWLILGAILAFALTNGLAIAFGGYLINYVPQRIVKVMAGLVFIIFGLYTMVDRDNGGEECKIKTPFISAFSMVFLAELGDKTQVASGLFATTFNPWLVFAAVMVALGTLTCVAVYFGKWIAEKIERKKMRIISGLLFILVGALAFL